MIDFILVESEDTKKLTNTVISLISNRRSTIFLDRENKEEDIYRKYTMINGNSTINRLYAVKTKRELNLKVNLNLFLKDISSYDYKYDSLVLNNICKDEQDLKFFRKYFKSEEFKEILKKLSLPNLDFRVFITKLDFT